MMMRFGAILLATFLLGGCVHKLVTVPVKAVYTVGKYTVKGTAAVVGAVIPDGDDDEDEPSQKPQKSQPQQDD